MIRVVARPGKRPGKVVLVHGRFGKVSPVYLDLTSGACELEDKTINAPGARFDGVKPSKAIPQLPGYGLEFVIESKADAKKAAEKKAAEEKAAEEKAEAEKAEAEKKAKAEEETAKQEAKRVAANEEAAEKRAAELKAAAKKSAEKPAEETS